MIEKPHHMHLFKPAKGEMRKYRAAHGYRPFDCMYSVHSPETPKQALWFIATHFDPNPGVKPPEIGYRLTESDPDRVDHFRDSGWEVIEVQSFPAEECGQDYTQVNVCYCAYRPLPADQRWSKRRKRIGPSLEELAEMQPNTKKEEAIA